MKYLSKDINELHSLLIKGEVTPLQLVQEAIEKAKQDDNNAFEYILEKEAIEAVSHLDKYDKNNPLWGIPFVLKDNLSTKDVYTTASSNILKGYVPTFSSEVYTRLQECGAILIGKTTLDEFGMGGRGTSSHLGPTFNPWDRTHQHIIGGSSCGSASACANGIVPFSIGSDTGDSVRKPASYGGLVGFKPTWGRISRYGLFPFCSSLDHIAYFTRNVKDSALLLNVLAGHDEKDGTSSSNPVKDYVKEMEKSVRGTSIAVIEEIINSFTDKEVKQRFDKILAELKSRGYQINYVHMDINLLRAIYPTYIILSSSEATSNTAYLDGVRFGPRYPGDNYEKVIKEARTRGFSTQVKKRLVFGSFSLLKENQDELYLRAKKVRRLIINAINEILIGNDFIFLPASPRSAPKFNESLPPMSDEYLIADNYLAMFNFGGEPSLTLPIGFKSNLPFGGNITGRLFEEDKVLAISREIEEITGLKNIHAEDIK